jgi:hypothetical protein
LFEENKGTSHRKLISLRGSGQRGKKRRQILNDRDSTQDVPFLPVNELQSFLLYKRLGVGLAE